MAFTQLVAISRVWIWAWNLLRSSFARDGASLGGLVLWLGAVCMAFTQLVATGSVWIWARNLLRGFFARDGACLDGLDVLVSGTVVPRRARRAHFCLNLFPLCNVNRVHHHGRYVLVFGLTFVPRCARDA